jgi:serine/threonine protein phosphatase PrpC
VSHPYIYARAIASSRQRPEDAAGVFEHDDVLVAVIADGAGGIRGGDAASRSLVAVVELAVSEPAFAVKDVRAWIDLFRSTDVTLAAKGAGETTGVVVVLGPRGLLGVSIGDSEAWVVTSNRVDDLTVGQQTKQRLGSGRVALATFERPFLAGVLVIATDGLFKFAASEVIARIVRESPIEAAAERLVELVRHPSGLLADDVALVLVGRKPVVNAQR